MDFPKGLLAKVRPSTLFFAAVAIVASAPAWIVRYPPLQDLPFHLAAIRVVHSFSDPKFGLSGDFDITLLRTQYVLYYLVGSVLAYVIGVTKANILLICIYLGGTPLAIRSLLIALRKDERICLFVIPLLVNPMFMFGLLPFVFGIPVMFWALAACVRYLESQSRRDAIVLAVLTFALFYSHLFPFGLFAIGYAAMFPWMEPKKWVRSILPVVPTLLVFLLWVLLTPTGLMVRGALKSDPNDVVLPLNQAISGAHTWTCDVFKDSTDEAYFIAAAGIALLTVGLAQGDRDRAKAQARWLVILPVVCLLLYFTTGQSRGPVWLFSQRFAILGFITAVPMMRMPSGWRGMLAAGLALAVGVGSTVNTCKHFIEFQLQEVGDIDGAIASMAPRKRVAALIYDKFSNITNWAPFHLGSYYQLEKGGVIQFSYAGWSHWPFDYKAGHIPPPGTLPRTRWEWTPEQVPMDELFPYYDYVLTRGGGFRPTPGTYHVKWRGEKWMVWERD